MTKNSWYLVLFALLGLAAIIGNELGYGMFSIFLLLPAVWFGAKAFE